MSLSRIERLNIVCMISFKVLNLQRKSCLIASVPNLDFNNLLSNPKVTNLSTIFVNLSVKPSKSGQIIKYLTICDRNTPKTELRYIINYNFFSKIGQSETENHPVYHKL